MGRTIHYSISSMPTKDEKHAIDVLTKKYNSNYKWTGENIDCFWSIDGTHGSTKVGSNELNAHLVIRWVLEASLVAMNIVFIIKDEGDAIYCPLLIRNGKAKPDIEAIESDLRYWAGKNDLHNGDKWDVTNKERYYHKLTEQKDSFGDPNQYIRPIINKGYLLKRINTGTQNIYVETISDKELSRIVNSFANRFNDSEEMESRKYYVDVHSFPL